jgi:hypothetical protein
MTDRKRIDPTTRRKGFSHLFGRLTLTGALLASTASAGSAQPSLETLDSMDIPAEGADGVRIEEFSGLSWDEDEQLLYAVSDGGVLHHFRVRLNGSRIAKIESVFSASLAMSETSGKPVTNAEGLTTIKDDNGLSSDSELLIAFEDGPSIARFTPRGEWIADAVLPAPLADKMQYDKKNSRLETVAFIEGHGILTAPERPLKGQPEDRHTLYAADGTTWSFAAYQPDSRLKAVQTLPDGNLLVLERTREEKGGVPTARLRYLDFAKCSKKGACQLAELLAEPNAMLIDNFEGMARLSDDLFLIVTDKTRKDAEPTTFVLFRVRGTP